MYDTEWQIVGHQGRGSHGSGSQYDYISYTSAAYTVEISKAVKHTQQCGFSVLMSLKQQLTISYDKYSWEFLQYLCYDSYILRLIMTWFFLHLWKQIHFLCLHPYSIDVVIAVSWVILFQGPHFVKDLHQGCYGHASGFSCRSFSREFIHYVTPFARHKNYR
jgi:hypothetical protein